MSQEEDDVGEDEGLGGQGEDGEEGGEGVVWVLGGGLVLSLQCGGIGDGGGFDLRSGRS